MRALRSVKGYSIIEMMVVAGVGLFIIGATSTYLMSTYRVVRSAQAKSDLISVKESLRARLSSNCSEVLNLDITDDGNAGTVEDGQPMTLSAPDASGNRTAALAALYGSSGDVPLDFSNDGEFFRGTGFGVTGISLVVKAAEPNLGKLRVNIQPLPSASRFNNFKPAEMEYDLGLTYSAGQVVKCDFQETATTTTGFVQANCEEVYYWPGAANVNDWGTENDAAGIGTDAVVSCAPGCYISSFEALGGEENVNDLCKAWNSTPKFWSNQFELTPKYVEGVRLKNADETYTTLNFTVTRSNPEDPLHEFQEACQANRACYAKGDAIIGHFPTVLHIVFSGSVPALNNCTTHLVRYTCTKFPSP